MDLEKIDTCIRSGCKAHRDRRSSHRCSASEWLVMTDPNTDISGLVELLIAPLVEFPDEVEVTSTETEDGSTLIEVSVNPEDVGRVIGRQGRIIKAIRYA